MKVLITGGAGFIGSTVASACLDNGWTPVILDDLSAGRAEFVVDREFYRGDIADGAVLDRIFAEHPDIAATVHCAARTVVPESMQQPLRYYRENVAKTIALLDHLIRHDCRRVVFSSSASIYVADDGAGVDESAPIAPASPYAATKAMMERVLADAAATGDIAALSLRYFNPIGADPTLRTGLQNPAPTHALGRLIDAYTAGESFTVTGVDWPTRDGSAIRDFIHVWDLAGAHVAALERFDDVVPADPGSLAINLGTGRGTTVWELVAAFRAAVDGELDVRTAGPRPGDTLGCYTRSDRAAELLGWRCQLSEVDGVRDALAWAERRVEVLGE